MWHWGSGVPSRCRPAAGHADAADPAPDGRAVERGWPGPPVRSSRGLLAWDGGMLWEIKLSCFWHLPHCPFLHICQDAQRFQLSRPRWAGCGKCYFHTFLLRAELSLLLTPALTATGSICNAEITFSCCIFPARNIFVSPKVSCKVAFFLLYPW